MFIVKSTAIIGSIVEYHNRHCDRDLHDRRVLLLRPLGLPSRLGLLKQNNRLTSYSAAVEIYREGTA